ncbi:MAG: excinuclease ABC subunit A [Candidatus Dadabacteria bacterium]|nr:MAG: excinuclease ABC subunit A [Candidatus Dadabacteria bacterium]
MSGRKKQCALKIVSARENNLKNISLDIPHDSLTVVTGRSGSGKSSLAFDTVYAEGQRRYIETFSPYTRQFFEKVKRPDVDLIENVRPAVAIQQRTRIHNARSTVGSMTGINDYLRLFWSNLSVPVCSNCGIRLKTWDPNSLAEKLKKLIKFYKKSFLIATALKLKKSNRRQQIQRLTTLGFSRYLDLSTGEILLLEDLGPDNIKQLKELYIIIDRINCDKWRLERVRDSIEQALFLGEGRVTFFKYPLIKRRCWLQIQNNRSGNNVKPTPFWAVELSLSKPCALKEERLEKARPSLFSYNHPFGACPECNGFGRVLRVDPELCIPNPNLSINEGALKCWSGPAHRRILGRLKKFCRQNKIPLDKPWKKLSEKQRELVFNSNSRDFRGVYAWFKAREKKAYKMHVRVFLAKYRSAFVCDSCGGKRLKPQALAYLIDKKSIADIWQMPVSELFTWFKRSEISCHPAIERSRELKELHNAITSRLECMLKLGLGYLTLDRPARTLSGGETQRVNLVTAIGSELVSTQFVLDEPSVGLHAADSKTLTGVVKELARRGNSVLMVEHDPACIEEADRIIEIGPLAGERGGEITYSGKAKNWQGIKFQYAQLSTSFNHPDKHQSSNSLIVKNATKNNLKRINLEIPCNCFVSLCGVSGSGKSTLVEEVIYRQYERFKFGIENTKEEDVVQGFEQFSNVALIDQTPLSKTPRANVATYARIWDHVRDLLSSTDSARTRALSRSSFSFNVSGGRCPACKGAGVIREDMQFLSDVFVVCEACLGSRFQQSVLEVKYNGKSVSDFLDMTVSEAVRFFDNGCKAQKSALILEKLGLGYLRLGHSLSELSGGEAQRLKLVPFISGAQQGSSLLIFDEPSTGLHPNDVELLIKVFRELVQKGHTVLCVEHNLQILLFSDYLIELGPAGGEGGGYVIKSGSPHDFLKKSSKSITAEHLKSFYKDFKKGGVKAHPSKEVLRHRNTDLIIKGAREHNLKNISLSVPRGKIVALTGVSGSGKSTLARDIIYAEGQRRFLDCLSPYARQFIRELKRPEVEAIYNVSPTICVYQHTFQPGALSTVATLTEIYNYLRLLYAKIGEQYCPDHVDSRISNFSAEEIVEEIKGMSGRVRLLAPVIINKKGTHKQVFTRAIESEINEVRVDRIFGSPSFYLPGLERNRVHTIEFVVASINPSRVDKDILIDAVTTALSLSGGVVIAAGQEEERLFNQERMCPRCKRGFLKPDPEDLSFVSKRGACKKCSGRGTDSRSEPCKSCEGSRLNPIGRNIRINGLSIFELCSRKPEEIINELQSLRLNDRQQEIVSAIIKELIFRLDLLIEIGLEHLKLTRDCSTLSAGELQRLRLIAAAGSPLSGVLHIFDEPSAGLHPLDNHKVLKLFKRLKNEGNSVFLIEHDPDSIRFSDYLIELGPGGGSRGGEVVFIGETDKLIREGKTETAEALRNSCRHIKYPQKRLAQGRLRIKQAECNNLKKISTAIPLGMLVTVCGVSGAGKSSLVHGVIEKELKKQLAGKLSPKNSKLSIEGETEIERVLVVDQKPIGKNSRSTPASYLGIWSHIRSVFAATLQARAFGWDAGFFSYNTGKGRCPACGGRGRNRLEMSFLPQAYIECEQCGGKRFSNEALSIEYQGKNIADVLNMTFEEANSFFVNHKKIFTLLEMACRLGLGYLTLGQESGTLSGGECQRIKLIQELAKKGRGHTLYILDEPTTGLHRNDVLRLMQVLHELVDAGNTIILIEHDSEAIWNSDWVVEIGPEAGEKGGELVFEGSPQELITGSSPWGRLLKRELSKGSQVADSSSTGEISAAVV